MSGTALDAASRGARVPVRCPGDRAIIFEPGAAHKESSPGKRRAARPLASLGEPALEAVVRRFAQNREGRDYVVGDIHGCFDLLEEALDRVGFDAERDRLFSVGDLVDRGEYSPRALEWWDRPWFHACMGNHEEMILISPAQADTLFLWVLVNGGGWWLEVDEDTRARFVRRVSSLPLALEVQTAGGRVGIVHADVPEAMGWPRFLEALERGETRARETALWGRRRAARHLEAGIEGIDRVVCGHTIFGDRQVHVLGNVWFIDTGAFLRDGISGLTLLALDELF